MAKRASLADVRIAAVKVHKLEGDVEAARAKLDSLLLACHEDGASITALARMAGVSRQAVYNAINRYRAQLGT
jgi:predicted transcriptional regulator